MDIVVAVKVVPDDQDIQVTASGELDFSKAGQVISTYDVNAIEAAAQLAAAAGDSKVHALAIGPAAIDDSKLKKNILARGADDLFMVADDAYAGLDAHATAQALAAELAEVGSYDVIICGDGSADNYAQQVGIQLAYRLGIPSLDGVVEMAPQGGAIVAKRKLDDVSETIEVPLPCVISVTPDIALPRIPGMRDILAAGKKPMNMGAAQAIDAPTTEAVDVRAPEAAARKQDVRNAADDGAVSAFVEAIKAALE